LLATPNFGRQFWRWQSRRAQARSEEMPFRRISEPFEFYRKEGQFTRRFAGCDLPVSLGISVAYAPSSDAFGGYDGESHLARQMKLSLVQRVEYKRTLAARFEEVSR